MNVHPLIWIVTLPAIDTWVSQVKDPAGHLNMVAKAVLIINHSNVDSESLFSQYGLTKTKHKNRLGIAAKNLLLTIKVSMHADERLWAQTFWTTAEESTWSTLSQKLKLVMMNSWKIEFSVITCIALTFGTQISLHCQKLEIKRCSSPDLSQIFSCFKSE